MPATATHAADWARLLVWSQRRAPAPGPRAKLQAQPRFALRSRPSCPRRLPVRASAEFRGRSPSRARGQPGSFLIEHERRVRELPRSLHVQFEPEYPCSPASRQLRKRRPTRNDGFVNGVLFPPYSSLGVTTRRRQNFIFHHSTRPTYPMTCSSNETRAAVSRLVGCFDARVRCCSRTPRRSD